ncbi:MAG: hypothetical protein QM523_07090 [Candidatus Pacebacteria bacterium]|nr:hypothetical protein [Candidatus Paceibacterota bacterium]
MQGGSLLGDFSVLENPFRAKPATPKVSGLFGQNSMGAVVTPWARQKQLEPMAFGCEIISARSYELFTNTRFLRTSFASSQG